MLSLPVEVEERVIDFVGASFGLSSEWNRTLQSCALVCKAWLPRCRLYLYRTLRVPNTRSLERLGAMNPGSTFGHTRSLIGDPLFEDEKPDQQAFFHLMPHFLATKLPHVSVLEFTRNQKDDRAHVFHPTFFMYMSHFRGITSLWLHHHRFLNFTDIRLLVASLPELANLHLHVVHWETSSLLPRPIPRSTKWRLQYIDLHDCDSISCGVQFWILPGKKASRHSAGETNHLESHPGISMEDAIAMIQILEAFDLPQEWSTQGGVRWGFVSQMGSWGLDCKPNRKDGQKTFFGGGATYAWFRIPDFRKISLRIKEKCETSPTRAFVQTLRISSNWKANDVNWQQLDSLLAQFDELELLEIVLDPFIRDINNSTVITDDEKSSIAKNIAQNLVLLRTRCKLKIMIDMEEKEEIPWANLIAHPHQETNPQQPDPGQTTAEGSETESTKKRLWDRQNLDVISKTILEWMDR